MSNGNELFVKTLIFVALIALMTIRPYCTTEGGSREALQAAGYKDIGITGWGGPFMCGSDAYSTGFTARPPGADAKAPLVEGTVCCGIFKGCTIRH